MVLVYVYACCAFWALLLCIFVANTWMYCINLNGAYGEDLVYPFKMFISRNLRFHHCFVAGDNDWCFIAVYANALPLWWRNSKSYILCPLVAVVFPHHCLAVQPFAISTKDSLLPLEFVQSLLISCILYVSVTTCLSLTLCY